MKNQFVTAGVLFLFIIISLMSCSKEDVLTDQPCTENCEDEIVLGDGISESDLPTYQGDIGIVASVREIQRKGYSPKSIEMVVHATSGDFSKTIDLNPYTLMGQIKLPLEALSEEAQTELREGVKVVVKVMDETGAQIWEETISKISFQSIPSPVSLKPHDLEDVNTQINLKSNTPYYIQVLEKGAPTDKAIWNYPDVGGGLGISFTTWVRDEVKFTGGEDEKALLYTFEAIPGTENIYAIKNLGTDRYLRIHQNWNFLGIAPRKAVVADLNWRFPDDFINGNTDARFMIKENDDGSYRLESVQGERIVLGTEDISPFLMINHPQSENISFRFVPMNIDWSIENIETRYMEPILPPAKNEFSYNSTLINCGQGGLSQTIGNSKTVETVTTVGWEETISISSSHSAGGSVTVGMEVNATFFDLGATYSAEATADYNYTTTSTTETTNWNEAQGATSETFFSDRTITVPSKSASLVYDAFQSYDNIKVNVVQRLRVRAREHDTGESLSGEEIETQFHFNGFKGVVTEVGEDYIEVALRGVATLDKIFKSQSDVQEVNPNCGG